MVILFSERKAEILLLEVNKETAILDTCCAGSTAGEEWIEANIDNRSQEDRSDIKRKEGRSRIWKWKNLQVQAISPYAGYFCNIC